MHQRSLTTAIAIATLVGIAPAVLAAPVLMEPAWAQEACAAWNQNDILTGELAASGWSKNDKGRGYKIIRIYRQDCPDSPHAELRFADKDGKATCVSGGAATDVPLLGDADYLMWAETERWLQMGKGDYGPMRAMMFGRLKFEGPMWEAMGNMGPFEQFLLLVGKVAADGGQCPKAVANAVREQPPAP